MHFWFCVAYKYILYLNTLNLHVQTILPISTKRTITSHLNSLNTKKTTILEIQLWLRTGTNVMTSFICLLVGPCCWLRTGTNIMTSFICLLVGPCCSSFRFLCYVFCCVSSFFLLCSKLLRVSGLSIIDWPFGFL